ncbi:MAG: Biotin transporter BioY2 [Chlamydiae bacterium]|nr:Biotin transporter BioY2 [Chlamydiota bacterium]
MSQILNITQTQAQRDKSIYWPILQVILASCFIGLCAQISIPLHIVPISAQTFGVMLVGATLGKRKGALAAALYLIQGSLGYPVFAGGSAGFHHLLGPTGGYLLAYPLEAYLFGRLIEQRKGHLFKIVAAILITFVQLGIGAIWLIPFVGMKKIVSMGFFPFVPVDAAKAMIVYFLVKSNSNNRRRA